MGTVEILLFDDVEVLDLPTGTRFTTASRSADRHGRHRSTVRTYTHVDRPVTARRLRVVVDDARGGKQTGAVVLGGAADVVATDPAVLDWVAATASRTLVASAPWCSPLSASCGTVTTDGGRETRRDRLSVPGTAGD